MESVRKYCWFEKFPKRCIVSHLFFLIYKGIGTPITPGASTVRTSSPSKDRAKDRARLAPDGKDSDWGGSSLVSNRRQTRSSTQKNNRNDFRYKSNYDFDSTDDEYSPTQFDAGKRRKRLKKKPKTPEPITLSSDSESDVERGSSQFKVSLLYYFVSYIPLRSFY